MGARGRPCQICLSPELKVRVEATRETGASYREIAALVGLDKFKIARHFKHSPARPVADGLSELELSDKRLATLADRLEQQFASACVVGDQKLALDATKALSRIETERHRRIVKKVEEEAQTGNKANANTPEKIDEKLRWYRAQKVQANLPICSTCGQTVVSNEFINKMVQKVKNGSEVQIADPNVV
jgi:hypothetical protein